MHEKTLKEINSEYEIIKRFEGGMSNLTYLIQDKVGKKYVYRYPGKNNDMFVNYVDLEKKLKLLDKTDFTNKLVYYDSQTGIKISEYIEGKSPDINSDIDSIVIALKNLHTSGLKFENYNHLKRLEKYEKISENSNEQYFDLKNKWLEIYENVLKEHIIYPTHGDSQLSNIVVSKDKAYLIDWEFSGMNDYIYDIAAFGNNGFDLAIQLLITYEGKEDIPKIKRLYGWRIFQCLQWYNVAVYKHNTGLSEQLNLDFLEISNKYLSLVNNLLNEYTSIEEEGK